MAVQKVPLCNLNKFTGQQPKFAILIFFFFSHVNLKKILDDGLPRSFQSVWPWAERKRWPKIVAVAPLFMAVYGGTLFHLGRFRGELGISKSEALGHSLTR